MTKPPWIYTYSGRIVPLVDGGPEHINIDDIAHHLAGQARWGGATSQPLSVAQHCVLCSHIVPAAMQAWGLLHDGAEAYLIDLPRPLKAMLPSYRAVELLLLRHVADKFDLGWPMPHEVHAADESLLGAEARDLIPPYGKEKPGLPTSYPMKIQPWGWRKAKDKFLERAFEVLPGFVGEKLRRERNATRQPTRGFS